MRNGGRLITLTNQRSNTTNPKGDTLKRNASIANMSLESLNFISQQIGGDVIEAGASTKSEPWAEKCNRKYITGKSEKKVNQC